MPVFLRAVCLLPLLLPLLLLLDVKANDVFQVVVPSTKCNALFLALKAASSKCCWREQREKREKEA